MITEKPSYFASLDTAYFLPDRIGPDEVDRRVVGSTGTVLLSMLVRGVTPVLSQTQAFDCPPILAGLERPDRDTTAFLQLVRAGDIQVRILGGPGLREIRGERYTLLNAFGSALVRPEFQFAGWPELDGAPELRLAIADQLDGDPDGVDQITGGALRDRLIGLVNLDAALRASPVSERANPISGPDLGTRALAVFDTLAGQPAEPAAPLYARIAATARAELADGQDYRTRSRWRALLRRFTVEHAGDPTAQAGLAVAEGVVDAVYNAVVRESLGVAGLSLEAPDRGSARALAERQPELHVGDRAVALTDGTAFGEPLGWSEVGRILPELRTLAHPASRLAYLREVYREQEVARAEQKAAGNGLWAQVRAAPVGAAGGFLGGVVGLVSGPILAASISAVVGAGAGLLATYLADRLRERDQRRAAASGADAFDLRWSPTLATDDMTGRDT